jgi:two-component system, NarL family, sensor histidine kinase DegS
MARAVEPLSPPAESAGTDDATLEAALEDASLRPEATLGAAEASWEQALLERRGTAVAQMLRSRGLERIPRYDPEGYEQERFVTRARTLFYARLAFLALGLGVLAIPGWSETFGLHSLWAFAVYFAMVGYSVFNYLLVDHPRLGRAVTFVTLCCDLLVMVYMIAASGGLRSPLLATQLLFTTLFVILFPKPLAIIPPLLTLPVVAKIDQLLHGPGVGVIDLFILLWYSAINFIVVYVMVYLNEREETNHRDVINLQSGLREMAVLEERNRLAREIHDGLGASLSSLIIQSEYLENLVKSRGGEGTGDLVSEIREMKSVAEESIDELRRNVSMMREDFDLVPALEDYCRTFQSRSRIDVGFDHEGRPPELPPDVQLTIFRVLQESLTNVVRHAEATKVSVGLSWRAPQLALTVQDDGRGFDAKGSLRNHYGLTNMSERARSVGGEVKVESAPGEGTSVALVIRLEGRS